MNTEELGSPTKHATSPFVHELRTFFNGRVSREQLMAAVDRHLADSDADAVAMLAQLDAEHERAGFPKALHEAIAQKILDAVGGARAAEIRASIRSSPPFKDRDDCVTVVVEQALAAPEKPAEVVAPEDVAPRSIAVGTVLQHRFKLIGHIGEGGMSQVFKAVDLRKVEGRLNDPYVAVKLLTVPTDDYKRSITVLQSEAQKLQSLAHPNIVRVIDCDRDGRTVFMTMEYLTGEPLTQKFQTPEFRGLPNEEALRIIESIASALSFAHGMGIVHGDLKPGNVIITERGEIKVIDFGIARMLAQPGGEAKGSESAEPWGELTAFTPSYASPQMLERQEPDARDDIYALACVAYETLTGRHPFDHVVSSVARDSGLAPRPSPSLSHRQFKALARALAFNRDARTSTVERFMRELRDAPPSPARWRTPAAVLASLLVSILLAVGYWMWRKTPEVPPPVASQPQVTTAKAPAWPPGKVFQDCPTCPLIMVLPPGRFDQGGDAGDVKVTQFELPRHPVSIAYPLGMGIHEVTRGEFKVFVDATNRDMRGCETYDGTWRRRARMSWNDTGYPQSAQHPVTCISWNDAKAYVQWLSTSTGQRYRLPSASEWEYAARTGSVPLCSHANVADQTAAKLFPGWQAQPCSDGYVYTAPVGSFAPNEFGLRDMLGNVFEWTEDCWQEDYAHATSDGSPALQGDCAQHEMRGGSWFTSPDYVRTSYRNHFASDDRSASVGFRVVRVLGK